MKQLGSHWMDFRETWYWMICQKSLEKIRVYFKSHKITGALHEYLCTLMIIFRWILLAVGNISDKRCRERKNTHFLFTNPPPRKSCLLWGNRKYGKARQAINDNKIRCTKNAIFVPDNSYGQPEFFVGMGGTLTQLHLGAHKCDYMFHDSLTYFKLQGIIRLVYLISWKISYIFKFFFIVM
jgi:hypothetical protein